MISFEQTILPGFVITVMTLGVAAVELLLKFRSRRTWRDAVLQEIEIYRQMEQSKSLQNERDAMRALRKSIVGTVEAKAASRGRPVPLVVRLLGSVSMMLASVAIGLCVVAASGMLGFLSGEIVEAVLLFISASCGVEIAVNIASAGRARTGG